jgi:hypothetical protein
VHDTKHREYTGAYLEQTQVSAMNLVDELCQLWENRSEYEARSHAAIERVRAKFDKQRARDRLGQLYELCR